MAAKIVGRPVSVAAVQDEADSQSASETPGATADAAAGELRAEAMDDHVVQAMLEVFPAEIRDVEKIDP